MTRLKKCIYAKTCEIYQNHTSVTDQKLVIHKNVFCHRGEKGWENCKEYLTFKSKENNNIS